MCDVAAPLVGNAPERFFRLVSERERVTSSGWRFGVAVPYARVDGLSRPMVAIGRTEKGIDFDSRDRGPARKADCVDLTPDNRSQQDLLADAGQLFSQKDIVDRALAANSFVELLAALECTGEVRSRDPIPYFSEVAVGTTIADRPPHRSARALISACGSYQR